MEELERMKIKALVDELKKYSALHTEFVSVYVPAGYPMAKIKEHLFQEQNTAANIKSSTTRKNVIDALEKMQQYLKNYNETPKNGLAIFSGNIAAQEGKTDVRVWAIEPPIPINFRIYRCDKNFLTEPLEEMCVDTTKYGLVVMDRREFTIGLLEGKSIKVLRQLTSDIPGKSKAGGQSAQRFARLREGALLHFFKEGADAMKETFLPMLDQLKGILLGGPGPTKYDFLDEGQILDPIKQKIIAVKDITYTDEYGLEELVNASEDVLKNEEFMREKLAMNEFFTKLAKEPQKVEYGYDAVLQRLYEIRVEKLFIHEDLEKEKIDALLEAAKTGSPEIIPISSEVKEGAQLKQFGGVAAILRY
ncbi:MAG: peptide chain release factor aRF-1 [Candidatus Woesearchaeota archaeon]